MHDLHELPIRRNTLLLLKNWLEEHDGAIKRDFRSAKQYESFMYRFLDMLTRDSSAMYWLIEGSLEVWYNKTTNTITLKQGEGFHIDNQIPPLEGQMDIMEILNG